MSVTNDLISAFKSSTGNLSDYRIAKIIGVAQPSMTKYNNGTMPLSPEKILIMCEFAGFDAVDWLLRLYRERAKSDKEKSIIDSLRNRTAA